MELDLVDGAKQLPPPPKLPDTTTSSMLLTRNGYIRWSEATASASSLR